MMIRSPKEIEENNQGIFEVKGTNVAIDVYMKDKLDLKEFRDYVLITNQVIMVNQVIGEPEPFSVKMLHFVSMKGFMRFIQSGVSSANRNGVRIVRKWLVEDLKDVNYSLFK